MVLISITPYTSNNDSTLSNTCNQHDSKGEMSKAMNLDLGIGGIREIRQAK